jgi:hypothetical protein
MKGGVFRLISLLLPVVARFCLLIRASAWLFGDVISEQKLLLKYSISASK